MTNFNSLVQSSSAAVTNYYGNLAINSPTFSRNAGSGSFYYQAYTLNVDITGSYVINSNSSIDLMGYLYQDNFFPSQPILNVVTFDDDGAGNRQFRISSSLVSSRTYILVVTTYDQGIIGPFSFTVSGPGYGSAAFMPDSCEFIRITIFYSIERNIYLFSLFSNSPS